MAGLRSTTLLLAAICALATIHSASAQSPTNLPDPSRNGAVLPPGTPPGAYDPLAYQVLIQLEKCPGFEQYDDCYVPRSPRSGPVQWSCPAGSFCVGPGEIHPCTPGFYCPEHTVQPQYCPARYFCSEDTKTIERCPKGHYCPEGTTSPRGCYGLASCPEGSKSSPKFGVLAIFAVFSIIAYFIFRSKTKTDDIRRLKHKLQADAFVKPKAHLEEKQRAEAEKPQLSRLTKTFDIRFENLGKTLPTGVEIMKGVTGELKSGRTCAIMGPSGAGKTTFVTLLTGKMSRSTGGVYVNNTKEELSKYKKLIGYVPQEDVMLRELTVRDILMHSARMRLPVDWDAERVSQKVMEIIHFLGMSHVMDNIIGDEEERGISGGQRKRVNIGMELVAEPSILFLDEPTSGLDSSTAFEVCSNLRNIAQQQGLLVAAVIHSPSPATFRQFDDLLLLGKGGQVVYFGPREDAVQYFDTIGFTIPVDESPSDFYMDVTSGKVPSAYDADFKPSDLFEYWNQHQSGRNPFAGRQEQDPYALL
ncbi:hypothetical protein HK097_009010, partial [Rhizophlyctis rosea]